MGWLFCFSCWLHSLLINKEMSISEYIKIGFGIGIGSAIANILLLVLGVIFFAPGVALAYRELKKPKEERNMSLLIVGGILTVIGGLLCMVSGGSVLIALAYSLFTSE